jgi:hypothetical protein
MDSIKKFFKKIFKSIEESQTRRAEKILADFKRWE